MEEEEESDLDMAWKMLDIARVIYEKQESHSIEQVDVITALADVREVSTVKGLNQSMLRQMINMELKNSNYIYCSTQYANAFFIFNSGSSLICRGLRNVLSGLHKGIGNHAGAC